MSAVSPENQSQGNEFERRFERVFDVAHQYGRSLETITRIEVASAPVVLGSRELDEPALVVQGTELIEGAIGSTYRMSAASVHFGLTSGQFADNVEARGPVWKEPLFIKGIATFMSTSELFDGTRVDRSIVLKREEDPRGSLKRTNTEALVKEIGAMVIPGSKRIASMFDMTMAPKSVWSEQSRSRSQSRADFAAVQSFIKEQGIASLEITNNTLVELKQIKQEGQDGLVVPIVPSMYEYVMLAQEHNVFGEGFGEFYDPDEEEVSVQASILTDGLGDYTQHLGVHGSEVMRIDGGEYIDAVLDGLEAGLPADLIDKQLEVNTPLTQQYIERMLNQYDLFLPQTVESS